MKKIQITILSIIFISGTSFGFGLSDIGRAIDKSYKCRDGDQGCKNRQHLLAAAKVAAVVVVAKFITDMVVEHRSKKVADETRVASEYKTEHQDLPAQPVVTVYNTSTLPGSVVQPGKKIIIQSDIVVVPGREQANTLIEERLSIFDNEDNTKELKSLTKIVNEETKRAGHYSNQFTFTLPEGLPQGVYPIKTVLLLNGEAVQTSNNDIQLVLQVNAAGGLQFMASRD